MTRLDIIKQIINRFGYKSYLEIGTYRGDCFRSIKIQDKNGVDPNPAWREDSRIYVMTSDEYFNTLLPEKKYDIVFIDGLHDYEQVLKDICNSLKHLTQHGTIVLHDCNPPTEWHQRDISKFDGTGKFNGTVWKSFVEYRSKRKDLSMFVIDCDWGVGIIRCNSKNKFLDFYCKDDDDILSYAWLDKNRKMALNLISPDSFEKWITQNDI